MSIELEYLPCDKRIGLTSITQNIFLDKFTLVDFVIISNGQCLLVPSDHPNLNGGCCQNHIAAERVPREDE
jgi:hypothetical protein